MIANPMIDELAREGFRDLRQMTRGMDFDKIEFVSHRVPYAGVKYGEAQLRYLDRRVVDHEC